MLMQNSLYLSDKMNERMKLLRANSAQEQQPVKDTLDSQAGYNPFATWEMENILQCAPRPLLYMCQSVALIMLIIAILYPKNICLSSRIVSFRVLVFTITAIVLVSS